MLIVLAVAGAYVYDEVLHPERVSRNVAIAGIDVSGYSTEDATDTVQAYEQLLVETPAPFVVDGVDVILDPPDAGLAVDEQAVVDEALAQRREGGFFSDFLGWVGARWDPIEIEVPTTVDNEMIEVVFHEWDRTVIDHPAYEGAVLVENNVAVPEYPRPGSLIDRPPSFTNVAASLDTLDRIPVALPLTALAPVVTNLQVDDAVARANDLIGEPVMLWREGFNGRLMYTQAGLASALRTEASANKSERMLAIPACKTARRVNISLAKAMAIKTNAPIRARAPNTVCREKITIRKSGVQGASRKALMAGLVRKLRTVATSFRPRIWA